MDVFTLRQHFGFLPFLNPGLAMLALIPCVGDLSVIVSGEFDAMIRILASENKELVLMAMWTRHTEMTLAGFFPLALDV